MRTISKNASSVSERKYRTNGRAKAKAHKGHCVKEKVSKYARRSEGDEEEVKGRRQPREKR